MAISVLIELECYLMIAMAAYDSPQSFLVPNPWSRSRQLMMLIKTTRLGLKSYLVSQRHFLARYSPSTLTHTSQNPRPQT